MGGDGARGRDWCRHGGITCVLETQFSHFEFFPLEDISPKFISYFFYSVIRWCFFTSRM